MKKMLYIYIYPSSSRSFLFIDIRYTYIHSHMSLCHALSRPTTYTYQLKHVKTTVCAHGHIPTWTKVLKLETCLCPGFPTTLWRMIRHFFSGSLFEASRAQILCAAEWLSLGNPKTCKTGTHHKNHAISHAHMHARYCWNTYAHMLVQETFRFAISSSTIVV